MKQRGAGNRQFRWSDPRSGSRAALLLLALTSALYAGCSSNANDDPPTYTREQLMDPETCKECHQDHFTEWSGSMHAYASTDPIFLAMNARGQKETNGQLGNFCVNCHAPMAVREGATQDGTGLADVPAKLQGITCYFCHQVTDVTGTHNSPLVLANDTTMRGGIPNPVKYNAHHSKYSTLHDSNGLESSKLCGACHDIVVPAHFSGASQDVALERTFAEWSASYLNDPAHPVQAQSCGRCHFDKQVNVPIASPPNPTTTMPVRPLRHIHQFPAIDTALVSGFPETDAQLQAVENLLDTSLLVQICVAGVTNIVEVKLENLSAGHNFPSGAAQDRRIWVELHVYELADPTHEICSSGVVPAGQPVTATEQNPATTGNGTYGTWLLRDVTTKADGQTPAHMFWDVANVNSKTIPIAPLSDPSGVHSITYPYDIAACAGNKVYSYSKITATVWVEAVGMDVFDDMETAGYPLTDVRSKMQRLAILPFRNSTTVANPDVTLEWTSATATAAGDSRCIQTTAQ